MLKSSITNSAKITMRLCLVSIIFLTLFLSVTAEKKIDITPIKLPYDSLVLTDIFSYNSTILVRSENTIYKSIDDGKNWEISFESERKINQLYSLDPHTIFIVGDSGLVYRTFDYGDNWIDISYDTEYSFVGIAAKNFEDYLIINKFSNIYHKKGQGNKIATIQSASIAPLYNVIYKDSAYFYGGGFYRRNYYAEGTHFTEFKLNYYIYNSNGIKTESVDYELNLFEKISNYQTDSLSFFNAKYGLIYVAVNNNSAGMTLDYVFDLIFDIPLHGLKIEKDRIVFVDNPDEYINIFTREGFWATMDVKYFTEHDGNSYLYNLFDLEHQDLNIKPINSVFSIDSTSYIIASNNSMIYKAEFTDIISEVESINQVSYSLFGNKVVFNNEVNILSIYNYMGTDVDYERLSDFKFRLPKGLNFITYIYADKINTLKVVVFE